MWYIADCIKGCLCYLICTCASYEYFFCWILSEYILVIGLFHLHFYTVRISSLSNPTIRNMYWQEVFGFAIASFSYYGIHAYGQTSCPDGSTYSQESVVHVCRWSALWWVTTSISTIRKWPKHPATCSSPIVISLVPTLILDCLWVKQGLYQVCIMVM